jgi:hypothetical protein
MLASQRAIRGMSVTRSGWHEEKREAAMKSAMLLAGLIIGATTTTVQTAFAQAPHDEGYDYVYKIQISAGGALQINVIKNGGLNLNGTGCDTPYYAITASTISSDTVKAWLQLALASYLSRTSVWVWTNGCTGGGTSGYPILTKLQIQSQ